MNTHVDDCSLEFTNLTAIERTKLENAGITTVGQLIAVFISWKAASSVKPIAGVSIKNIASALKPWKENI
jgi:hypothetical protein